MKIISLQLVNPLSIIVLMTILTFFNFSSVAQSKQDSLYWGLDPMKMGNNNIPKLSLSEIHLDSIGLDRLRNSFSKPENLSLLGISKSMKVPTPKFSGKPLLSVNGGQISYNWNYRSQLDTPFLEKNLSQHFVSANIDFVVAKLIPIKVLYFERKSNSKLFQNYRNVRVIFDAPSFENIQASKAREHLKGVITQLHNPSVKTFITNLENIASGSKAWLNQNSVINQLIKSRATVMDSNLVKSIEVYKQATSFILLYDSINKKQEEYTRVIDSLQKLYIVKEKQIQHLMKLINGNLRNPEVADQLLKSLEKYDLKNKHLRKLISGLYAVKKLAVGKTMPDYSSLSLKNINVNGINFEYNRRSFYLAVAAGAVDYRFHDFIYSKTKRVPQTVYAFRSGYGRINGNHIILTYFKGKKNLPGNPAGTVTSIYGLTLAAQFKINKYHQLSGEIGKSATPSLINSNGDQQRPSLNLEDRNNTGYQLRIKSYFPKTKTRVEAYYQFTGINYQSFSGYKPNATTTAWKIKMDQYLWKRQLFISGAIQKNDFYNPLILQRYNANTSFKNIQATFRKKFWPTISAGYLPSSQYTVVDSLVYENHYQMLNLTIQHQYPVGIAKAYTVFMYNQFYNDQSDSAFIYYNADNFYFRQSFEFSSFTSNLNISHTENSTYTLDVIEGGVIKKIFKKNEVEFGVKVNHINTASSKTGFYTRGRFAIPLVGDLNIWLEKNYLPGQGGKLIKSEFYSIGLTRYFR